MTQCNHKSCVSRVPIFSNLNQDEMSSIAKLLNHSSYKKGEVIYSPGIINNNLYIVNDGMVKITRISSEGKELIQNILTSGDFTNELALFNNAKTTEYVTAMQDSKICIISKDALNKHILEYPATGIKIIEALSARLNSAVDLIEGMTIRSAMWRLAKHILDESKDDIYIHKSSKVDLASKLGMTQETLSRKLAELQDLDIIKYLNNKTITITNLKALKNIIA